MTETTINQMIPIVMFFLGGLIATILFKPKKTKLDKNYIAMMLAFEFYYGIHHAQKNPSLDPLSDDTVMPMAMANFQVFLPMVDNMCEKIIIPDKGNNLNDKKTSKSTV